ncbi:MAG: molybdate ABC transporter permease subunit [Bacillota bacterium]|jgi:molybdate transport system permease protein
MVFDFSPLIISLKTSIVASVIVSILGILMARLIINANGKIKWLMDVIFTLPLVLPPTVVGFLLLIIFGKNSVIGSFLDSIGIPIIFTWQATLIAAVVVSFPLMYRAAKGAMEQVDNDLIWAGKTLGLSELKIFISIIIPQAWPGIAGGLVLSFARALGEFGATLMIAGNIPQVTQTMPLAIYFATAGGKMHIAAIWVVLIICISCSVLGLMNYWSNREKFLYQRNI